MFCRVAVSLHCVDHTVLHLAAAEADYLTELEAFIARNASGSLFAQDIVPNTNIAANGIEVSHCLSRVTWKDRHT